jgi:tetratricopeptide (TPR) repeat protein
MDARAAFEQGRAAYERGAFGEALAHFERAQARSPRAELLYNIARSADSDGQTARALSAYSAYLEAYPTAQNREFVKARLEKVRAREQERQASRGLQPATPTPAPLAAPPPPDASPSVPKNSPADALPSAATLPTVAESAAVERPVVVVQTQFAPRDETQRPVWRKAWFWSVLGVAVAGTVTAVVIAARQDPTKHADGDVILQTLGAR